MRTLDEETLERCEEERLRRYLEAHYFCACGEEAEEHMGNGDGEYLCERCLSLEKEGLTEELYEKRESYRGLRILSYAELSDFVDGLYAAVNRSYE